jgi:hypothetical protein
MGLLPPPYQARRLLLVAVDRRLAAALPVRRPPPTPAPAPRLLSLPLHQPYVVAAARAPTATRAYSGGESASRVAVRRLPHLLRFVGGSRAPSTSCARAASLPQPPARCRRPLPLPKLPRHWTRWFEHELTVSWASAWAPQRFTS